MKNAWQRGKYIKFFAKMKIRVGGANAIDIQTGDEFEYDGSILKYSGMEVSSPQLRGAIENGWATVDEDSESEQLVEAVRPSRNIAKTQTVNRDLSKVQRISNASIQTSSLDEDEVLKVSDRGAEKSPKVLKSSDNRKSRGMNIQSDANDSQEAVSIGRVRTSAKAVFNDVMKGDSLKKMQELENMSGIKADLYESKTVTKEGVTIKSNLGRVSSVAEADDDSGDVVGKVRTSSKSSYEGISVQDTSSIRNVSTPEPSPSPLPKNADPRIRIARAIDPHFPADWSFSGKLAERLAAVKEHGGESSPKFLEALFAAEGDQMRKVLMKEFPNQFGS